MREPLAYRGTDPSRFERTEQYIPKRIAAYFIDAILVIAIFAGAFLISGADMADPLIILAVLIISGIATAFLKGAFDLSRRRSLGRALLGMRVETLDEDLSIGDAFMRNGSAIIPFLLPALDMAIGMFTSEDDRQKFLDAATRTLVVEDMPVEAREVIRRAPVQVETQEKPEKFRLGFDQGYAKGNCPRCGAPYRVLPPGDQRFDGLWNHRCTWCNALIHEGGAGWSKMINHICV